ncbi:GAF domain-containing protein [Dyadobacter sp. 3J3]|uniref:GAF domain-containing protein n=1 Tax=Dyadobacter sp. 3J3 TaxID=2606600 RepID=UPI001358B138|nr:GAF domain-containing protein [Dyadobacter sp. 3J3]
MMAITLDISNSSAQEGSSRASSVCFRKFINWVKVVAKGEPSLRNLYLETAVELLTAEAGFLEILPIQQTLEFKKQLKIVYNLLLPSLSQEENIVWAIGVPLSPIVFYGTDSFYNLVTDQQTGKVKSEMISDASVSFPDRDNLLMIYAFILEHLFGIVPLEDTHFVITIHENKNGLPRYFRVNIDNRFTEVFAVGQLPDVSPDVLQKLWHDDQDIVLLSAYLPLDLFRFEGISVISLMDITVEYTIEAIKTAIFENQNLEKSVFYRRVTDSLKILIGDQRVHLGFIPVLRLNGKLIIDRKTIFHSKQISVDIPDEDTEEFYILSARHFIENPRIMFLSDITFDNQMEAYVAAMKNTGVQSHAIMPIYNDAEVVGLLEVYSTDEILLDERILSRLHPATPLISRIFKSVTDEFDFKVEAVIKEKYTSIQQSVQWKFKETAWQFLRDSNANFTVSNEKITFKNVYPLYGAIDIKNSTSGRNKVLRQDMVLQFNMLITVFFRLNRKPGLPLADHLAFRCKGILDEISLNTSQIDETRINEFLDSDIHPFLHHFIKDNPSSQIKNHKKQKIKSDELKRIVADYFESLVPENGIAYAHRRAFEKSMQLINAMVSGRLDQFKTEIQPFYPAYFEKFRTDGVEYDIYIGQSIEPEKKFNNLYLENVKLWQLSSMSSIVNMSHELLSEMEEPLETTQLIFINSGCIDICFREDERRFDVEGSYNIRYQVIKKRIDKVRIRETGERLTQPGKIAMVYFNEKAVNDYLDYVHFLQAKNVLLDDLEYLELEELQGVSGLKALRIGVVINH